MQSKVADEARRAQLEDLRRMSGEQRLLAFVNHNRLVAEIRAAGERSRQMNRGSRRPHAR
jgi:hypothetical protein